MITPLEAEKLANETVNNYVNKCNCKTNEDVANVLMKLISMSGLAICVVTGKDDAVKRLTGTVLHISKKKPEFEASTFQ